jgi:7-carboxy-7-deazaguanine synthase
MFKGIGEFQMKIYSIYNSINGEVSPNIQGSMTTFIRTAGCNLRCKWCDTKYAQKKTSGKEMSMQAIVDEIGKFGCANVTITGGEPLLQERNLEKLTDRLYGNYFVCIETNGSIYIPPWGNIMGWVADWKLPSSGMSNEMKIKNFENLVESDFIKFVIADLTDFDTYLSVKKELQKTCSAKIALSPAKDFLKPSTLVDWIKVSGQLDVIVSLQLHKIIWPDSKIEV